MTAREPIVGSDNNAWGTVLNTFLSVSLNSDGTINPAAVKKAWSQGPASPQAFTPSDTTFTTSTNEIMAGFGNSVQYTPTSSGICLVLFNCGVLNANITSPGVQIGGRYGTVLNGVPAAGVNLSSISPPPSRFGPSSDPTFTPATAQGSIGVGFNGVVTLVANVTYWFDICYAAANASSSAAIHKVSFSIMETS